jgi:hypothetical protein
MENYSDFLFRCSSIGKIMTNPQSKGVRDKIADAEALVFKLRYELESAKPGLKTTEAKKDKFRLLLSDLDNLYARKDEVNLSLTCRNYLIDLYVESKYGRTKDITNKYIKKGLQVEEDSITLLSLTEKKFLTKNAMRLNNEFVSGEPDAFSGEDIFRAECIYDTKSSWDLFTFSHSKYGQDINQDYFWQLQGYSDLTGCTNLALAYCLVNTPMPLINSEIQSTWYKMGCPAEDSGIYIETCAAIEKSMTYDDIPKEERIKIFKMERDTDAINKMHERILECRHYMNQTFKQ